MTLSFWISISYILLTINILLQKGGLGAQKVKTNFTEIENRAQQIDKDKEIMAANQAMEEAKSKEEQEKQM